MAKFFAGDLPDVLFHGSQQGIPQGMPCRCARETSWWRAMDWEEYDEGLEGDDRTAYANIVWEFLGLRDPERRDVPGWAKDVPDMEELSKRIGIFFVTDDERAAAGRYGPVHAVDMASPYILDVVPDPNPGTYNAWIVLIEAGRPLPLAEDHAPKP